MADQIKWGWDNRRVRDDVTRRSNKLGEGGSGEISQNLTYLAKTGRWNQYDSTQRSYQPTTPED